MEINSVLLFLLLQTGCAIPFSHYTIHFHWFVCSCRLIRFATSKTLILSPYQPANWHRKIHTKPHDENTFTWRHYFSARFFFYSSSYCCWCWCSVHRALRRWLFARLSHNVVHCILVSFAHLTPCSSVCFVFFFILRHLFLALSLSSVCKSWLWQSNGICWL